MKCIAAPMLEAYRSSLAKYHNIIIDSTPPCW